jgi:hypothetical protein
MSRPEATIFCSHALIKGNGGVIKEIVGAISGEGLFVGVGTSWKGVFVIGIKEFFVGSGFGIEGEVDGVGSDVDPRGRSSHCFTRRRSNLSV